MQQVVDVVNEQKNHATELIEDFMIAANGVVARMLEKVSSLRRIVKQPKRWDRIVATGGGRTVRNFRRLLIPKRSMIFWSNARQRTPIILPIFRLP